MKDDKYAEIDAILFGDNQQQARDFSSIDKIIANSPPPTIQKPKKLQKPQAGPDAIIPDNEQGWISSTGTAVARGAIGIGELGFGAVAGLDRLVDRYINAEPENDPDNWDLKKWANSLKDEISSAKNKGLRPATEGAKGTWSSGVESFVTSAGIKVPAYILATLTAPVVGLGTIGAAGAGILGLIATSPAFGLSQYDEAVERYTEEFISKGTDPEKARNMAELPSLMEGSFEVLSEVISDIIGGKIIAPGLSSGKTALVKSTLRTMLKEGLWKTGAKRGAGVFVAETIGESLNSLAQLATQDVYGKDKELSDVLTDDKFWKRMEQQLGPIAVSSLLFGGLGGGGHVFMNNRIANALENPLAKKKDRIDAAKVVAKDIEKESPALAKVWIRTSATAIEKNEAISLDDPIDELGVEDPNSATGRLARAIVGEKPLPAEEPGIPTDEGPMNEDEIETYYPDDVLEGMASGETAFAPEALDNALIGKGFTQESIDFIKNKVKTLGSVEKVNEFYTDGTVKKYALAYARSLFSKQKDGGDRRNAEIPVEEDRRTGDRRSGQKLSEDMSKEELRDALLTDNLTLIANRRAYDEAEKKAVQVYIDGDSLKWFNDNMGHVAGGDEMLRRIAKALHEETGEAYRVSGDEFMTKGTSPEEIETAVRRAKERLAKEEITVTLPNGKTITKHGIEITYGIGDTAERADAKMKAEKVRRAKAGKRAERGELPPGVTIVEGEEGHDQKVSEILSGEKTETPEGIKDETWNSQDEIDSEISSLRSQISEAGDNAEVTAPMERRIEILDARKEYIKENPVDTSVDVTPEDTGEGPTGGPGISDVGGKPGKKTEGEIGFELGKPQQAAHEDRVKNIREGKTTEMPDDLMPEIKDLYAEVNEGDEFDEQFDEEGNAPTTDNWNSWEGMQTLDSIVKGMEADLDSITDEMASEDNPMDEKEETALRERIKKIKEITIARWNYIQGTKPPGAGGKTTKEDVNVEETPEEDTTEGPEEEAETAGEETPVTVDGEIDSASMDDLEAIFDGAATAPGPAAGPTTAPGGATTTGTPTTTVTAPREKTAGDIISEGTKAGIAGIDESMKGLLELFGGSSLKSFPAGFNKETYAKAKPHFEAALAKFREAGKSLEEFIAFIKNQFGSGIKPYLMQFFKDIKAAKTADEDVDVTEDEADSCKKGGTKGAGTGRKKKAEKAGGEIGGLRKDMEDALLQRGDVKEKNKPVEAILRKTSGILRNIKFNKEASFGLPRVASYLSENLKSFTEWAGREYGGSKSRYARFTLREAIDKQYAENPDQVIDDANTFIEMHTTLHNAFVGALTIDDALREVFPLFINKDADTLPWALESLDAWRSAVQASNYPKMSRSFCTPVALELNDEFARASAANLPMNLLAKMVRLEETQFEDTKNKEYKRKRIKVTEIETDGRGRNNEDVDAQKLIDAFGFWGIDYGTWAEGPHRQSSLNLTYDGLYELMDILGIPESLKQVISLPMSVSTREREGKEGPGELSIAYGAMARGGKAAAAYYPQHKAIGITKEKGDGSLAHEWSHGLNDLTSPAMLEAINDLQVQLRFHYNLENAKDVVERMVRNSSSRMMGETGATFESIREHLTEEFDGYFKRETDFFKDAKVLDRRQGGICGQAQSQLAGAYWSNDHELWARAFEAWISDNLAEDDRSAEYLVNRDFVEEGGGGALFNQDAEAYPKGDTRQNINEMLRYFFDNVEWSLDGDHFMKEDYENLGERNRREALELLDEVLDKGEELFNEIYKSEPSEDGLFWYAYKNTARGANMQPDGFHGYDDSFQLDEGHPEKGTGEGAIAYPERLSIEQTRNSGLAPIVHSEDGSKVYTGGENDTGGDSGQGTLGQDETGDGGSSGGTRGSGRGGQGGSGRNVTTAAAGNADDTGREQGDGSQEGEGDGVAEDVSVPLGGEGSDTAEGDLSVSAANPKDYDLTSEDDPAGKSVARRFADNLSAIDMLRTLESENRLATEDEQRVLAKYSGWAGMGEAFSSYPAEGWKLQANQAKETLTEEEFQSAREDISDTYNTPHGLGNALFSVLEHMGFMGGRILDPSVGAGNLFGLMPSTMRQKSTLVGVEKSLLAARIAKQLYQNARIQETSFQKAPLIESSFDLVVSNIPFDQRYAPVDAEHNETKLATQDYFVKKALDLVRPGGLVAVVASDKVLSTDTAKFLDAVNMQGELVGAFRLPTSVFGDAQDPVSSDLIFIRKKGKSLPNANISRFESLTSIGEDYLPWAPYFKEHPEHVLGTVLTDNRYDASVEGDASEALSQIPSLARKAFIGGEYREGSGVEVINPLDNVSKPGEVKPGGMYVAQNGLFYRDGVQVEMGVEDRKKMHSILKVRDTIRKLLREAYGDTSYGTSEEIRGELNKEYDAFVKAHGYLNADENAALFDWDPDSPLILSLEKWEPIEKKFLGRGRLLTESLKMETRPPSDAPNAEEAMKASLAYRGRLDLPYMSSLSGLGKEELTEQLGNLIYDDPQKGWVTAEEYLAGHIGRKLKIAEKAAAGDEYFARNVEALKKALPEKIVTKDIKAQIGAPWVPSALVQDFVDDLAPELGDGLRIRYNKFSARWELSWNIPESNSSTDLKQRIQRKKNSHAATTQWGAVRVVTDAQGEERTVGKNFYDLLNYALNGGLPKVASRHIPDTMPDYAANYSQEEKARIATNEGLTEAAMQKLNSIKREFSRWLMEDAERAGVVEERFNEILTGFAKRKFKGGHLPYTGKVPDEIIKLDDHQAAAVWRFLTEGTVYLGHEVGTGKTFTMAASIMESKRLGLMKKPILAVTSDTYDQIADHFLELYPGANLFKVDFTGKTKQERKQIYANITTGNWDAIIVKHAQLNKFPVDTQTRADLLRKELAKKRAAGSHASSQKYRTDAEREAREIEGQINDLLEQADPTIPTIESMGIDGIVVDEAHEFKNLKFKTRYGNIKGISRSDSQRASDLYMMVQGILARNGRNVMFGSGTPVSNSIAELYLIQQYLQQEILDERMLNSFDMWVNSFGVVTSEAEPAPQGGGFRMVDKISSYHNLPELLNTVNAVLDIVRTKDTNIKLPGIKGGEAQRIHVPANKYVEAFAELLIQRAINIRDLGANAMYGGERDIMLSLITAGRKAALDVRLINPALPDSPETKVNSSIDKILEVYNSRPERNDGTIEDKPVQFVFLDMGVPNKKNKGFNVYDDIKRKLVAKGIPESEIIFAQDYKKDKKLLSAKARSGAARVVIGSTRVLGVGINAQDRIAAMHNLDIEWNFANYEQRLGRMVRQGNLLKEVQIFDYGTKKSLDMFLWSKVYDKKVLMDQILYSDDDTMREFVDETTQSIAAGEMLMELADDPLQEEAIRLKKTIRGLDNQRLEWQYNQNTSREKVNEIPDQMARLETDKKRYTRALELLEKGNGTVVEGEVLDLKKDSAAIIKALSVNFFGNEEMQLPLIEYEETTEEVVVLDEKGNPIVDKKKQKEGVFAPAIFKTKKKKIRTQGDQVGDIAISSRQLRMQGGELGIRANNGIRAFAEIEDPKNFPSVARTLSNGIKKYQGFLEAIPDNLSRYQKDLDQAREILRETTFPQEKELGEAVARNEVLSAQLVENLKQKEAERAANPDSSDRTYLEYFPEPTPPAERRDGTPENSPLFSRDKDRKTKTLGKRMVAVKINDAVKRLSLENAPPIVAVQNESELPTHLLIGIIGEDAVGEVAGVYDHKTGKVYLIADNIKDLHDVHQTVIHEVMGHFGLRGILGDHLFPILNQVADFYGVDGLSDIAGRYGLDLTRREHRIRAAEEKLAFAQQEAVSGKERAFLRTIYAKIRQILRKIGLVIPMTDDDIAQLLSDSRRFAEGKIQRDSNPYPFGSSQVYRLGGPLFQKTARGKSLYPETQKRLDKARGKNRDTLKTHAESWLEKIKHAARHFPLLDPKKWGDLTNYLRVYEEVPRFSKYVAEREIRKFIKDLNPEEYDMFRMHILLGDLLQDVNKGLYDEVLEAGEPLPFGYKDKAALEADAGNIASQVEASEVSTKAIADRQKYMDTLKETLVAEKLLPQSVLEDDEYFHHQVLEYLNEKVGLGISSKDIRLKKKGFQKGRKGYTGDYNTEYVEAEFEIIAHAISQLQTKDVMDRVDRDFNAIGELRANAREENIKRVYDAFNYDPGFIGNEPGSDPFFPFNQKMAISFNRLGEMGSKGLIEVPLHLEDTLGRLVFEYVSKKEQDDPDFADVFLPNNEHLDDPGVFKLLSFLMNRGEDGAREAATIFKAIQDRKKFVTTVLGAKEVTWESLMNSDTHTVWRPKPNTAWYMTNSINDRIIERVIQGERMLEDEDVRKVLARGADVEWVIPKEVAETLDNFKNFHEETAIGEISNKILNTWKQWVLINPLRFFKYNINNMSGDADIVFAYAPEIIKKYMLPAFKDMVKDFRKQELGEEASDEFRESVRQGVLNGGMTEKEIPDITKAMEFERAMKAILPKDDSKGLNVLKRGAKGTWFFLKETTNLRENVLRLAAYRYFKDQLAAGNTPPGVSEYTKQTQVKDVNEKAALLARELLGDYGNLSQTSEWLRQKMIPFWSWQAINAPRYFRLYQNLQYDERGGTAIRGTMALAWKGGKTSLKVALLYAMINAWNAVVWPEEEEALGEAGRRQLHLILGKSADGHIISLRLQGALSDALGWFALEDLPSDVKDVFTGRATVGEKLKESISAPVARIYQGSRPLLKSVIESGVGLSTYPKFSSPRPVRDKWEHFLRAFSLDKFWNMAAGKPKKNGSVMDQIKKDFTSVFFYDTDVAVANYYDIRKRVFDFREKELGIPPQTIIPSNKSTALYYYKQAFRFGDVSAAEKYLHKYFKLGGTPKGIRTSIRMIHPLGGLAKKYRRRFIISLSPSEKTAYHRSLTWYRETYTKRHPEFKGVIGRAWKKSREK